MNASGGTIVPNIFTAEHKILFSIESEAYISASINIDPDRRYKVFSGYRVVRNIFSSSPDGSVDAEISYRSSSALALTP
jgi:hypothetical protein